MCQVQVKLILALRRRLLRATPKYMHLYIYCWWGGSARPLLPRLHLRILNESPQRKPCRCAPPGWSPPPTGCTRTCSGSGSGRGRGKACSGGEGGERGGRASTCTGRKSMHCPTSRCRSRTQARANRPRWAQRSTRSARSPRRRSTASSTRPS
ncbi:hypothetical protein T492DRAFT_201171 [Pavlovales sp. CCMP2436]|nr:hypothetical protein T492DRAFT_201171 [Pavlovales sp. CCMP2436]